VGRTEGGEILSAINGHVGTSEGEGEERKILEEKGQKLNQGGKGKAMRYKKALK